MKKQKRLKIRTGARTAAKVQEKEFISKAKKLKENPQLIVPKCEHEGRCVFEKVRRQIARVKTFSDDEKKLTKLAASGNQLARAYAATLLIARSEKAPYLAVYRSPYGEIAYALRGKVKREKLIGVQHYDKPKWRFFSLVDFATKKGLHIYYGKSGFVCKGRESTPPEDFVEDMMGGIKYPLKKEGSFYTCEHIQPKDISGDSIANHSYLLVDWKPAQKKVAVCSRCSSKKANIAALIIQNMAVPEHDSLFDIDVITNLSCEQKCQDCRIRRHMEVDDATKKSYMDGAIADADIIEKHLMDVQEWLKKGEERVYIMDEKCYGENLKAFIDDLNPADYERQGLEVILKKIQEPVVVLKATPNKVLSLFWDEHGKDAVSSIVGDQDAAGSLYNRADYSKSSPSQVLKEARILFKEREIISALPKYSALPPIAKFADDVARIYMTQGREDALRAIEHYRGGDTKIKSVAYSFLLALNQGASKKWQYTKTEIDFAHFLREFAEALLNSEPKAYHENLQRLLSATGSTKKIDSN